MLSEAIFVKKYGENYKNTIRIHIVYSLYNIVQLDEHIIPYNLLVDYITEDVLGKFNFSKDDVKAIVNEFLTMLREKGLIVWIRDANDNAEKSMVVNNIYISEKLAEILRNKIKDTENYEELKNCYMTLVNMKSMSQSTRMELDLSNYGAEFEKKA